MIRILLCILLLCISTAALIGFDKKSLCWSLLDLYKESEFSNEGLIKAETYNPDNDSVFLPPLENKEFFKSIEDLSICRRKEVRKFLYIYLTKGRRYVIDSIERSHLYLEIIKKEFNEFPGLPDDIILLPLLESGFNPFAVSRSRAVGLWQLLNSTSKILGLKRDNWLDERRDIKKSTRAALRHIKNIYPLFNSWELTLAAYNGGASTIIRSIQQVDTNDFWKLYKSGKLTTETGEFVPRFAALIIIYKNQNLFGLEKEIKKVDELNTKLIRIHNPVNLHRLSKIIGLPMKTIRMLNPELKRSITPPNHYNYSLRIPVKSLHSIDENPDNPFIIRYTKL